MTSLHGPVPSYWHLDAPTVPDDVDRDLPGAPFPGGGIWLQAPVDDHNIDAVSAELKERG